METVRSESARRVLVSVRETVVFGVVIGDVDAPVADREQGLEGGRTEVEESEGESKEEGRLEDGRADEVVIVVVVVERVA
jgi:hypothetical protein